MPFPGGLEATANGLLVFSVIASSLFLIALRQPPSLKRALIKSIAVLLLALLAFDRQAPAALVVALGFSVIGDFFLAYEGERNFKLGLGGFMAAQIGYVVLFSNSYAFNTDMLASQPWRFAVIIIVLAHSYTLALKLWGILPRSMGGLIVVYALIITMMGLSSLTLAPALVALGALLFIGSDTLIAYEQFLLETDVNRHPWISPAISVSYYVAQLMITFGVIWSMPKLN